MQFTSEYESRLRELRKTHTVPEMAEILGKPERTVGRHLKSLGLTKPVDRTDVSDEDVLALWNNGFTINEIAAYFSCSHDVATRRLSKHDISCDRASGIKRHFERSHGDMWPDIKKDLDEGMSMTAVSRKYKVLLYTVKRLMEKHDYKWAGDMPDTFWDVLEQAEKSRDLTMIRYLCAIRDYYEAYRVFPTASVLALSLNQSESSVSSYAKHHNFLGFLDGRIVQSDCVDRLCRDLDRMGIFYKKNDRTVLCRNSAENSRMELDLWIPDMRLGIEINPASTHSPEAPGFGITDKYYHQKKSLLAKQAGIGLLHLYDEDFRDKHRYDVILQHILYRTYERPKFGARMCCVQEVAREEYQSFLDAWHLQGKDRGSSVRLGLYLGDALVAVMGIGRPRYSAHDFEIIRYCPHPGYKITGCFGKLFRTFLRSLHESASIVSYVDLNKRFISHDVYAKNGFLFEGITEPDYVWVNYYGTHTLKRYQTTKAALVSQGYDADKSEIQIMHDRKYFRLYGAGSKRYVYRHIVRNHV